MWRNVIEVFLDVRGQKQHTTPEPFILITNGKDESSTSVDKFLERSDKAYDIVLKGKNY